MFNPILHGGGGFKLPAAFWTRMSAPAGGRHTRDTWWLFLFSCLLFSGKKNFGPRDKKDPSRACQNIIFFEKNQKFS